MSVTSTCLIDSQLEDKRRTLQLFMSFLKNLQLWPKIRSNVPFHLDADPGTVHIRIFIAEAFEKLDVCLALYAFFHDRAAAGRWVFKTTFIDFFN
jgi:hypothetical protein